MQAPTEMSANLDKAVVPSGTTTPRISFGIIVLNGEPFIEACIRSLWPHAHEIIVVEGACPGAEMNATPTGHVRDHTVAVIERLQRDFTRS